MTARELAEWRAYYDLEPFGDMRADYRTGLLASMIANIFRRKGDKPLLPTDFMLHSDAHPEKKTATAAPATAADRRKSQEEMIKAMKALEG